MRKGAALLQGIANCGNCGRRLKVYYQGNNSTPGYHCPGSTIVHGRGSYCLRVGGSRIDQAVANAFISAVTPAGIEAALAAEANIEAEHDAALAQWRLEVERARYQAERAERRYRLVEPENRLVARGLETEWNERLGDLASAEAKLARRHQQRPRTLTDQERENLRALATDVKRVWSAPTTTDRDRKELLRTLLEEVKIVVKREQFTARLTLRWRGGAITELDVGLRQYHTPPIRNDEETINLVRRLAVHYSDAVIAGILNRQGRKTPHGERFTANTVGNLRRYWKIPVFHKPSIAPEGELLTVKKAAEILGVVPSTIHRWLIDGFISGEQITPGAPWQIRITDELRTHFIEKEIDGYVPMIDATRILGVTRQTILQRVKRGELHAVHLTRGKRKGLRIQVKDEQPTLFDAHS